MKINKAKSEEFLKALDAKPTDKWTFVYQAIIVSLIAHIFVLFVTQMLTQDNRIAVDDVVYEELDMDMIEPEMIPPPEEMPEEPSQFSQLKNLIANENSQRSSEEKSYRGLSKAELNEQVYNDLKNMEAQEFARLNEGRPDYTVQQNQTGKSIDDKPKKSEYDWYKEKANNTSYSGRVTASFNMTGRDPLDNPVPTYRCKTQGKVVVLITINNLGQVTEAKIDEGKSTMDDCLRNESEKYALKWKFNYKADAQKKQDGTIIFTFSAQ